jgi:predicted alpha/beta hydrolase
MPHDENVIAVATEDGHRFELIEVGDRASADSVLLIPGMGIPARHYIQFARTLEATGHRVLIFEWRGIGSSSLRASRRCNWGYRALLQSDLDAAVVAARESAPEAQLWLAGHSLGGQLACIAAARAKQPVAGVAVIASGAPWFAAYPGRMRWTLRLIFRLFPALAALVGYFPGRRLGWGGNEARGVISDWARTGRTGRYDLPTLDFDAEAALAGLDCRLLVLRMADDSWVPQGSVDWLLRKMPGCPIEQRQVDRDRQGSRADHFNWLKVPAATTAELHAWLSPSNKA